MSDDYSKIYNSSRCRSLIIIIIITIIPITTVITSITLIIILIMIFAYTDRNVIYIKAKLISAL